MYSRKTGNIYSSDIQNKINNFNRDVQEQYRKKSIPNSDHQQAVVNISKKENVTSDSNKLSALIGNDELLLICLILLLLMEKEKDFVIIGTLAILLLNR